MSDDSYKRSMAMRISRREMLAGTAAVLCGCAVRGRSTTQPATSQVSAREPIIDMHQHANYIGRPLERLLIHQRNLGATQTMLLPFGSTVDTPSTKLGK